MDTVPIPIGHWPFEGNSSSSAGLAATVTDLEFSTDSPPGRSGSAQFNGKTSKLEAAADAIDFGKDEFTFAAWIRSDARENDVVGDLFGKFDPLTRTGINLCLLSNTGVTSTVQPNRRHLQFGIDAGRLEPVWQDCGRPGNAVLITSLVVSDGLLYAGTLETGENECGKLFRYDGGQRWEELGNPAGTNAVHSIVEFSGSLYCGIARYATAGSCLGNTMLNNKPGGQVYRINDDGSWTFCGHPGLEESVSDEEHTGSYNQGKADDAMSLICYRGDLYCVSNHLRGVFKYLGDEEWQKIGPDSRIISLTIYRGDLYALGNGGPVYRYLGDGEWKNCGTPGTSRQTYGAAIHCGKLYVGTWPDGTIHRYDGDDDWPRIGAAGYEREVMAMVNYNGNVYAGGLPTGSVYRLDGSTVEMVTNLDASPVVLRRVWSMAVYNGALYAGALPSGHVYRIQAGRCATFDETFADGWHHVAAVKGRRRLKLYVDGTNVAQSEAFHPDDYPLNNAAPLTIGFGSFEHFKGRMSDVRIYRSALDESNIRSLLSAD